MILLQGQIGGITKTVKLQELRLFTITEKPHCRRKTALQKSLSSLRKYDSFCELFELSILYTSSARAFQKPSQEYSVRYPHVQQAGPSSDLVQLSQIKKNKMSRAGPMYDLEAGFDQGMEDYEISERSMSYVDPIRRKGIGGAMLRS